MTRTSVTWKHDYIATNGIKLHYVTQGQGKLMLMLHGFPEFWYSWRHQIPEFARDYQVVALDLRGYNDSDKPPQKSAYIMSEFLADIKGAIAGLGHERCILVAHDWGGAIAWHFAEAYPEMLDRLIVLNLPHPAKFRAGLRTFAQLRAGISSHFSFPGCQSGFLGGTIARRSRLRFTIWRSINLPLPKLTFKPLKMRQLNRAL